MVQTAVVPCVNTKRKH